MLSHFSKRRNEIENELERTGLSGPAAADQVTLATRTAKVEIDQETLDRHWLDDGATIGFGPHDINQLLATATPAMIHTVLEPDTRIATRRVDPITGEVREELLTIDEFASAVAWDLPERNASVTRLDVQNAVADHLLGAGGAVFLERLTDAVLAHKEMVPLSCPDGVAAAGWEQRWTTRRMLDIEDALLEMFAPTPIPQFALDTASVDTALDGLAGTLGVDQLDTVRRLCTQGLTIEVVVGRAGTGKTYTMNAVRHVLAAHGRRLLGVCPTGRAARELADGAHIETFTVPRLLTHAALGPNDVLVVDEAGMCGTLDLHRILSLAATHGAKVILVGDHRQLPEVAAGGGFTAALDIIGDRRCELTVNRRQIELWEHAALDHLRDGDVTAFWDAYRTRGRITLADTREELHATVIDDWWHHHASGLDAHLIAGTRAEARLLNRLARQRALDAGHLGGIPLRVRDREFQIGDRVVLLSNMGGQADLDTGQRCRVDNGMIATITAIDHRTGEIDIAVNGSGRRIRLGGDYVHSGAVDHGYATTIHKAQGVTCDHIHVVGPAGLYREAAYVAVSRARRSAHLYATTSDAATIGEPAHTTGIPLVVENLDDPETDLTRAIATSRAKHFVTTDHPNLERISELAQRLDLGQLTDRLGHVRAVITRLDTDGVADPTRAVEELRLAEEHRRRMHVGGRVNARDWDNVGTIERLHDTIGHATVRFVSDTGHTTTRLLPWHLLKPIDHPDEAELTDLATTFLNEVADQIGDRHDQWRMALAAHGIDNDDATVIAAAISQRHEQLTRRLRATPPEWLRWWAGDRPTDPTAATVYDDHIADLAHWRDLHRIPLEVPGYGPAPTNPDTLEAWRQLTDRALATRHFLLDHHPTSEQLTPLDVASARGRLDELDTLLATAPPDQRLVVEQLLTHGGRRPHRHRRSATSHRRTPAPPARLDPRELAPHRRTPRTHRSDSPPRPTRPLACSAPT